MSKLVYAADLFCGAGGTSQGLARACERLGVEVDLVAVNHWPRAVATHTLNHPWARHYCARIESLDPRKVVPGGKLDLIVAGVECTHHSRARGGRPMSDQSRASAWHVLHWAEQLRVEEVLIENVAEFMQWGPIDEEGRPIVEKRGATFRAFIAALESLGYRVEHRLLTAADFGDPTTRRRFFLRASLNGEIKWPEPTHDKAAASGREPWRTARQIIDWQNLGESIFDRKKPLAPRTIERIAEGIRRFCGEYAEPFLVMLYGSNSVRSVDRPVPTVTAEGQHVGLAQPFLLPPDGPQRSHEVQAPRSVDRPMHTVRAERGGGHLVLPFLLPQDQFKARHGATLVASVDEPLRTVKASSTSVAGHLVAPCVVPFYGKSAPETAKNGATNYLVQPFIVPHFQERIGQTPRTHSIDEPCPTVTATKGAGSLVEPQLTPEGVAVDILFRMLTPQELARAQGFSDDYQFVGTKTDVVRQIGNAVPVGTAEHLCHSILSEGE